MRALVEEGGAGNSSTDSQHSHTDLLIQTVIILDIC